MGIIAGLLLGKSIGIQVPSKENLEGIKNALGAGGNRNATIREIAGLHHAFQECDTGMPDEYGGINQTFSPLALAEISNWVSQQCK